MNKGILIFIVLMIITVAIGWSLHDPIWAAVFLFSVVLLKGLINLTHNKYREQGY